MTQAICDYRREPGHRRPALPGQGHARAVRAGPAHRARGPGRQRGGDHHPARRRRDADPGDLVVHSRPQPRSRGSTSPTASSSRRRTTRRRTAASSTTRPTAVPPTPSVTGWIQDRANAASAQRATAGVKRVPFAAAVKAASTHQEDFVLPYVEDLTEHRRHGRHPRRRSHAWASTRSAAQPAPTGSRSTPMYGLDIAVVNPTIDPTFAFMTVDHDGKIRMDSSSPYAMARLVDLKDQLPCRLRQ